MMDKFFEVAKFYNLTRVHYLPALLIMGKPTWDKLSPEHRRILQKSADKALAESRIFYKKSYDEAIANMKKAGVQVIESDVASFRQASAKVVESLLSAIPNGKALFDKVQAAKKDVK